MLPNQIANRYTQRNSGFTTVELVVVIVLLGILAAYAAPRFTGRGGYPELTAQQDLIQSIRYAQQLAMSRTDRTIALATTANQIDVRDVAANISLSNYPKQTPDGVALSVANLVFNRYGSAGNNLAQITITGTVQTLIVNVEGRTGYAY